MKSVICAIVKNELRFIREWADYYLNIGFDKLYVYEDYGSNSHKQQLQDLIDEGKIELNNFDETHFVGLEDNGMKRQYCLYKKFLNLCKNGEIEADWAGFFDVDEFLMFENNWNLESLEDEFKDYGGVLLSWRIYGANGHLTRPAGNVVDNYTSHLPDGFLLDTKWKWNVKSLVNVKNCTGLDSIHQFKNCVFTDLNKKNKLSYLKAWLNHYVSKSWEDYCERMESRGNMNNNSRSYDIFFQVSPEMREIEKYLLEERRYNSSLKGDTMWISKNHKIIRGGNIDHLQELKRKYYEKAITNRKLTFRRKSFC